MIKTITDKLTLGEKLTCPVCGKEFKVTEDTVYITTGYTCSWKCFLNAVVYKNNPKQESENNNSEKIVKEKVNKNTVFSKPTMFGETETNNSETIIHKRRGRPKKS